MHELELITVLTTLTEITATHNILLQQMTVIKGLDVENDVLTRLGKQISSLTTILEQKRALYES